MNTLGSNKLYKDNMPLKALTAVIDKKGAVRQILGVFTAKTDTDNPNVDVHYMLESLTSKDGTPSIALLNEDFCVIGTYSTSSEALASLRCNVSKVRAYTGPGIVNLPHRDEEEPTPGRSEAIMTVEKPFWLQDMWVSYFTNCPELSEHILKEELESIHNIDIDFIKAATEAFAYQGFDPKIIMIEMVKNRERYSKVHKQKILWDLTKPEEDMKVGLNTTTGVLYSNQESFSRDMSLLNVLFWVRTARFDKLLKKSRSAVVEIIEMLVAKYNIDTVSRSPGETVGPRTITLARICHSMPVVGVRLFEEGIAKFIVKPEDFPGTTPPASKSVCCPALICVIPKDVVRDEPSILCLCLWVAIKHDDTLHKRETSPTSLADLCRFFLACHNTPSVTEEAREKLCLKLKILIKTKDDKGESVIRLARDVRSLATLCRDELPLMRKDDASHQRLRAFSEVPTLLGLDQFD
ncbi:S protein [Browner virus]|uniref:S protein n=1 Tax=Browner virus TaxID=2600347 RepID=A0A5B8XA10_9VIRU|nr:S protein [Browner virus]QED21535.1 S protein [Browner virus]